MSWLKPLAILSRASAKLFEQAKTFVLRYILKLAS